MLLIDRNFSQSRSFRYFVCVNEAPSDVIHYYQCQYWHAVTFQKEAFQLFFIYLFIFLSNGCCIFGQFIIIGLEVMF